MRRTRTILAAAIVAVSVGSAWGQQTPCAGCSKSMIQVQPSQAELTCPPCCTMGNDCCETPRHCCDNAWAGYCEHRAKVDAFWSGVGVPKPRRCLFASPAASAPAADCQSDSTSTPKCAWMRFFRPGVVRPSSQTVAIGNVGQPSRSVCPSPVLPSTEDAVAVQKAQAKRPARVAPLMPLPFSEKKTDGESTVSLWEWKF